MTEWISVADHFPEEGSVVIGAKAYGFGMIPDMAVCDFAHGRFTANDDALDASNYDGNACITLDVEITHWCELPELKK